MSVPEPNGVKTPKRVKVERNLYLRNDGIFEAGYSLDGRWTIKTVGTTSKTVARRLLRDLLGKADRGEAVTPSRATLTEVWADFEATFASLVAAGEKAPRTLDLYRQQWRSHIEPRLGRLPVQKITASNVSRLLAELRAAGLSSWTLKAVWTRLDQLFAHAMTRGVIAESPLRRIAKSERPSGKSKSKPRTLTDAECAKLIQAAGNRWRPLISTAVFCGARISEMLGLRWQDVDFDAGLIHVRYQLSVATKERAALLVPLKTDAGERDLYALPELAKVLRRLKLSSGHSQDRDFVFCTHEGKPLSQRNSLRALEEAADAAGLNPPKDSQGKRDGEPLGWHDLRHTAVSRLIAAGLDVVEVQRQAGHSKPSTTLDLYSHEFQRAKRSEDIRAKIAATGIGALLGS